MSHLDPELLEKELRTLEPAKPPREFLRRITEAALTGRGGSKSRGEAEPRYQSATWWQQLRWLAPGTAAAAVLLSLLFHKGQTQPETRSQNATRLVSAAKPWVKADKVEIDEQLISSFDAVARLPDGAPVRLRCREWRDAVVLRDSRRGVTIERQTPRFEVIPIRYDIY